MTYDTTLTANEMKFLRLVHTPGIGQRLRKVLDTGEGLTEEEKNALEGSDEKTKCFLDVLADLLDVMEECEIGA